MKTKALLFIFATLLTACQSKEDQIKSDAKKGLPQLAVMSSVYFAQYEYLKINHIYTDGTYSDNYLLQKNVETRFYGFDLNSVINSIQVEGDTLTVKLIVNDEKLTDAELKQWKLSDMTIDNKQVLRVSSSPNFQPPKENGKDITQ